MHNYRRLRRQHRMGRNVAATPYQRSETPQSGYRDRSTRTNNVYSVSRTSYRTAYQSPPKQPDAQHPQYVTYSFAIPSASAPPLPPADPVLFEQQLDMMRQMRNSSVIF